MQWQKCKLAALHWQGTHATSLPCFAMQTRLWCLDIFLAGNDKQAHHQKVHEASNFAYHLLNFWLGRSKNFQGEAFLLYYWVFIHPSALTHNPFSIQLNIVCTLSHTVFSQREGEWQGAGSGTGRNSSFFCLKLQFLSSKTMPTVQKKLWLCKMDGHIAPFFAIGYNIRSSSPRKNLPQTHAHPTPLPLFSPFQVTSVALQTHFTH